jgi:uncharacterized protein
VLAYNRDDCRSAAALRDWLEDLRQQIVSGGTPVPRPQPGDGSPNENVSAWLNKINPMIGKLTADIPANAAERAAEQQARWILANVLDWHRREDKAVWWELFRLSDLSAEDLLDEKCGLSGLTFVEEAGGTAKAPIHRYRFPPQETELRGGEELRIWVAPNSARSRQSRLPTRPSTSRSGGTAPASIPKPSLRTAISTQRF